MIVYLILATIVCALFDALRIKAVKGEVVNINKKYTVLFGMFICLCGVLTFCISHYTSFLDFIMKTLVFSLLFVSVRGVLYDAILNKLRGLDVDYESKTTNSKVDQTEINISLSFWEQRSVYLTASIFFYLIFKFLTL